MSEAGDIVVRVVRPPVDFGAAWDDLVARATPNVFMHPAAVNAAHETGFADIRVLAAYRRDSGEADARLVGVWALAEERVGPLRYLAAVPHAYAFVATPVVDRAQAANVIAAMFAAIAEDRTLPKAMLARYLDDDPAVTGALAASPAVRNRVLFNRRARAFLTPESGAKRSGSTRKKLRQDWNRLAALDDAAVVADERPEAVREAFEIFLAMEAASWKGAAGTALLNAPAEAHFARRLIASYADQGAAFVALLTVAGKPIAAQVVLKSGARAYTWKIAYDEAYQKYSPGSLLVDRLSETLVAGGCTSIDSCSPEGGFMSTLWSGRQPTVDVLAEISDRQTLAFPVLAAKTLARAYLKRRWLALRSTLGNARRMPKPAAVASTSPD
jgi:CelD/BcsL family acetyltransferase involved in cellulose biosynthesis